jgi:hypothetical protein
MVQCSKTFGLRSVVPACLLLLLAAFACQPTPAGNAASAPGAAPATRPERPRASSPIRDLSQDEAAGGHTLRKHVGRTDAELRQRLRRERAIAAASTWTDRDTAQQAVGVALEQNRDKIDRWLNRPGGHPNLVIDYDGDPSHPIGRTLRRGDDQVEPCAHATIVLKWSGANDYYVLTSYPECRA